MQRSLDRVWHRFAWTGSALHRHTLPGMYRENLEQADKERGWSEGLEEDLEGEGSGGEGSGCQKGKERSTEGGGEAQDAGHLPPVAPPFRPRRRYPVQQDAFSTLMMWLHGRIEGTR